MIWYNKDKTILVDLTKIESFVFNEKGFFDSYWNGMYMVETLKPKLSLNWDKIILWNNDAKEVWEILKNKLKS